MIERSFFQGLIWLAHRDRTGVTQVVGSSDKGSIGRAGKSSGTRFEYGA